MQIETTHLLIADRQPGDLSDEMYGLALHPELQELDPPIGECRSPLFYSVLAKEVNVHIGTCSLYNFNFNDVELGVRIFLPDYWNKGYGTEIVNALCEYVFTCFPSINAIFAKTPVLNIRAMKCYAKCGFKEHHEAVIEGHKMLHMIRYKEVNKDDCRY